MRILAIDPGISNLGWAAFDGLELLDWGVDTPLSDSLTFNGKMNEKLIPIYEELEQRFHNFNIDRCVWELVPSFSSMSMREMITQMVGLIKSLAWSHRCLWREVTPIRLKMLTCHNRSASKDDMVDKVFDLFPNFPVVRGLPYDVYDAILLGWVAANLLDDSWAESPYRGPHCSGR